MNEVLDKLNEWVAVLKSGTKFQGKHLLQYISDTNGKTYNCCLGVLGGLLPTCTFELNAKEAFYNNLTSLRGEAYFIEESSWIKEKYYLNTDSNVILKSDKFKEWAEKQNLDYTQIYSNEIEDLLVNFNDDCDLNFLQIAEFLELFFIPYVEEKENEKGN